LEEMCHTKIFFESQAYSWEAKLIELNGPHFPVKLIDMTMDMVVILLLHGQQIAQPLRLIRHMHSNRQKCIVTSNGIVNTSGAM